MALINNQKCIPTYPQGKGRSSITSDPGGLIAIQFVYQYSYNKPHCVLNWKQLCANKKTHKDVGLQIQTEILRQFIVRPVGKAEA